MFIIGFRGRDYVFSSVRVFIVLTDALHGLSPFPQGKGDGMKEEWIAYIVKQTLQGLKYFHDQGQVGVCLPFTLSGPVATCGL